MLQARALVPVNTPSSRAAPGRSVQGQHAGQEAWTAAARDPGRWQPLRRDSSMRMHASRAGLLTRHQVVERIDDEFAANRMGIYDVGQARAKAVSFVCIDGMAGVRHDP